MKILDIILNKSLPFLDGYKTIAAGALAAIGCATAHIASITNPETSAILLQVSEFTNTAAGYLGAVGVCGKIVKKK